MSPFLFNNDEQIMGQGYSSHEYSGNNEFEVTQFWQAPQGPFASGSKMSSVNGPGASRTQLYGQSASTSISDPTSRYIALQTRIEQLERQVDIEKALHHQAISRLEEKFEKLSLAVHTQSAQAIQVALPVELTSARMTKKILDVPPPMEQLDVENYPYVKYWHSSDWIRFKSKKNDVGMPFHKLQFMEDEDGKPVSSERLAKMTKTAKELWNELYSTRSDPATWSKKLHFNSQYFARTMQLEYPEFCYCDGNWKADAFATIRFPDWNRADRSSGALNRAEPSIDTKKPEPSLNSKKRKSAEKDKFPTKKKRSSKENQAAPCSVKKEPTEVIEIDSESDSDPVVMPVRRMQPHIATEAFPQATSSHLPSLPPDDTDLGLDKLDSPRRLPLARSESPPSSATMLSTSTPLSEATNSGQSSAILLPVANGFVAPASPLASGKVNAEQSDSDGHGNVGKNRRLALNPFSNLTIPKPSVVVPASTSSATSIATEKPQKAKSKKLMVPNTSSTARNLFAIDYLKDHAITAAEFKVIFDNLGKEELQKYEALSKKEKRKIQATGN